METFFAAAFTPPAKEGAQEEKKKKKFLLLYCSFDMILIKEFSVLKMNYVKIIQD